MKIIILTSVLWVAISYLSLANQPFYEEVFPTEELIAPAAKIKKTLFLCATVKDCKEGNSYIFSELFDLALYRYNESGKYDMLEMFQKEVEKKFPKNVVEVSIQSVSPLFSTRGEALKAYNKAITDKTLNGKVFTIPYAANRF